MDRSQSFFLFSWFARLSLLSLVPTTTNAKSSPDSSGEFHNSSQSFLATTWKPQENGQRKARAARSGESSGPSPRWTNSWRVNSSTYKTHKCGRKVSGKIRQKSSCRCNVFAGKRIRRLFYAGDAPKHKQRPEKGPQLNSWRGQKVGRSLIDNDSPTSVGCLNCSLKE